MQQRWAARGWLGRCAAALACCYCGPGGSSVEAPTSGRSGGEQSASASRPGSWSKAGGKPLPDADVEEGKDVDKESNAEDWEPASPGGLLGDGARLHMCGTHLLMRVCLLPSRCVACVMLGCMNSCSLISPQMPLIAGHRRAVRLGHVLLFCLLWVPVEALVAAATASTMGAFGEAAVRTHVVECAWVAALLAPCPRFAALGSSTPGPIMLCCLGHSNAGSESLFVCLDSSCAEKMPWRRAREELDWENCKSFRWQCTLDGYSIGMSAAVGGLFLIYSAVFLLLM